MKTAPKSETPLFALESTNTVDRHEAIDIIRNEIHDISENYRVNQDRYDKRFKGLMARKRAVAKIKRLTRKLYKINGVSDIEKLLPVAEAAAVTNDEKLTRLADIAIAQAFPITQKMPEIQRNANMASRQDFKLAIQDTDSETPFAAALLSNEDVAASEGALLEAKERMKIERASKRRAEKIAEQGANDDEGTVKMSPEEIQKMLEDDDEFEIPKLKDDDKTSFAA